MRLRLYGKMNKQTGKSTKICRKMQIYIWQDKFRESLWLTQINGKISFFGFLTCSHFKVSNYRSSLSRSQWVTTLTSFSDRLTSHKCKHSSHAWGECEREKKVSKTFFSYSHFINRWKYTGQTGKPAEKERWTNFGALFLFAKYRQRWLLAATTKSQSRR